MQMSKKDVVNMISKYADENEIFRQVLIDEAKNSDWIDIQLLEKIINNKIKALDLTLISLSRVIRMYSLLLSYTKEYPPIQKIFDPIELSNVQLNEVQTSLNHKHEDFQILKYDDILEVAKMNNIYNPEQKTRYIYDQVNFNAIEKSFIMTFINFLNDRFTNLEFSLKKDLCFFTKDELLNALTEISFTSFFTYKTRVNSYIEWCIRKQLIPNNSINIAEDLVYENLDKKQYYITQYYKNFQDLQSNIKTLKKVCGDYGCQKEAVAIMALLLVWIGFDLKETLLLKLEDIDFKNNKIFCQSINKTIEDIPKETMSLIYKTYIDLPQTKGETNLLQRVKHKDSLTNTNLRGYITDFNNSVKFLKEDNLYKQKKLTYKKVRMSGFFSRIYLYEKEHNVMLNYKDIKILKNLYYSKIISSTKAMNIISMYNYWKEYLQSE